MTSRSFRPLGYRSKVIILNDLSQPSRQWDPLVESLKPRYDVSIFDLPSNRLKSSAPCSYHSDISLDGLELERRATFAQSPVHVVAHSIGAAVALTAALRNPICFASLSLVEPALFHLLRDGKSDDQRLFTEICALTSGVHLANLNRNPTQGVARYVNYWYGAESWTNMSKTDRLSYQLQSRRIAAYLTATFYETWRLDTCRALKVPVTLVTMNETRMATRRIGALLADAIQESSVVQIAGCGHMAPITHPELVNRTLVKALDTASSSILSLQESSVPVNEYTEAA